MNDPIGKYTLINADEIIDDWVAVFQVLSLPQFKRFQEMVDYRGEAPTELMEIAREFVANTLSYLRIPNPLMRPELLNLDMKAADDPAIEPLSTWWHSTISKLEAIGCAEVVYQ